MKCPNRNSKEFKELQSSNGIDTGTLELIIQKYWIQSGDEDSFPTDVYVQAQLGRYPHWTPVKKAVQLWEKVYSTPREFDSVEKRDAFIRANLVEQCFSPRAIYKYTTSDGKYVLAISRPVTKVDFDDFLPGRELSTQETRDLELVMKEFIKETVRNDGTAVMDDLMEQKDAFMNKLQRKGSDTTRAFTFKDGMTVSTPFELNYQQKDALNEMNDFIKSDEPVMTLSGYAGTGKTSIMEIMAHRLHREGKEVLFSASTNKAASVLRDRVSKAGFNAQTLHRIFGIQVEVDRTRPYNANNLIQKLNEKDFIPGTIVVIDEASMIDNNVYNVIKDIARHFKLKIIFVGDPAQLKPVKEDQISKVFRNNDGRQVTLTKVERTGDNAILEEATRIRNGEGLSGKSSFNSKGEGVAYVKPSSRNTIESVVKHYVGGLRSNPNYFRILAYTNATVARYNTMVRNFLGYNDNIPRVGEPILGYKNWGKQYNKYTKETTYRFINSESYEVIAVEAPQTRSVRVNGSTVEVEVVPVTLKDSFGKIDNIDFIDIKGNPRNLQAATIIAREKARLSDYMNSHQLSKAEYAMTQDTVNYLESFLFINDDITEPDPSNPSQRRALQKKYFDFGYAMTIHKSQGSTFTNVLVDDHDVVTSTGSSQAMTSLDFGSSDEDNISPTDNDYEALASGIDLDFGGGSNETLFTPAPQATPSASEINQMQQQLEYVAVSRATDTVTVISNNTANEDSPLNHLKDAARTEQRKAEKKYDTEEFYSKQSALDYIADLEAEGVDRSRIVLTHIPETDTTDDYYTVSVNPEGIVPENTIASQMIDHLRSMGIPVLNQADMIEYFNTHEKSLGDAQQAIETKEEYQEMLDELSMNVDKTDTFLYNFMEKVLNVKPKYKVDEKTDTFVYDYAQRNNAGISEDWERLNKLTKKIFGYSTNIVFNESREDFELYVDSELESWESKLIDAINNPQIDVDPEYARLRQTNAQIDLLQRFLNRDLSYEGFTEEEKMLIETALSKYKVVNKKKVGYAIQQLKKTLPAINAAITTLNYQRYATILAAKNRLVALNTIKNLKEIVKARLIREYDSYNVKPSTYQEKIAPKIELYKAIRNAAYGKGERHIKGLFNEFEQRQATFEELEERIIETNPEFKELLKLFRKANPQLKIIVGVDTKTSATGGECPGWFRPRTNTLYLSYTADVYTAVHELAHSATYYGLMGRDLDDPNAKAFADNVSQYMDYIRGYIKDNQLSPDMFAPSSILGVKTPAEVYGFTNPSEFLAELFGNPDMQELLDKIPPMEEKSFKSLLKEIWNSIIDFLNRVAGNPIKNKTALEQAQKLGYAAMSLQQQHIDDIYKQLNKTAPNSKDESTTTKEETQNFETPQGEVYGFVTKDGKIYLDETVISPEHPIHEYTHLWDNVLRDKNPKLWEKGVSLMKRFTYTKDGKTVSLWKEVEDSDQYGKVWKSKGYTGKELEHLIASEVHARLVGENGAKLLEDIAAKKGSDRIIEKLKQWILDAWKELKATFSNWTQEEIDKLTLKDFNHMVVRDFADGINPTTQEMPTPPQPVGGSDAQIKVSKDGKLPEKGEQMVNKFREYYLWQRDHITFDEKNHKYYLDGKPIDYSVTEYMETVYGAPNIIGDYSHSRQMGNDVDAITRDFFIRRVDVSRQQYPNLNEERKNEVIGDLQRLKQHFDEEFGEGKYKVITSPMVLVGTINVNGETKTIAGTMDMIVVDENGDIYPFDMKVKNHPITKTYNGKEVDDRRNYTFQLNGYRQLMQIAIPETSGRIKPARLIWFDTAYPRQGREALFTTDAETHVVTVSDADNRNVPLAKYPLWQTPRLKKNITESLIPLETKDVLPDVRKVSPVQQQPTQQQSILSQGKTAQYGVQIDSNLPSNYKQWQQNNPSGIVAYRVNKATFNTPAAVEQGVIGNPFDWQKYGTGKATEMFYDWLTTGNNYGEPLATEEFRNVVVNKIQQSQAGTPILYYKELNRPSHATVIGYLINNKQLLQNNQQQPTDTTNEKINNATQKHQGNWTRQEAENNPRTLYVFTDNTDRDSGSGVIPADSWYSKKYGEGHHFPTITAAVVRGLNNSRPISTQRWYHNGAKGVNGRWTDVDVEEFKRVIKEELEEIVKEFNTGKYDNIMFPDGDGLFNTSNSNITKERTPQLYQALTDLLHEYGFDKLIPSDVTAQTIQQPVLPGPETKMEIWAGSGQQNPDLSNVAKRPFTLQLFEGEAPIQFNSVEQAFQYTKFRLLAQFLGFEETKKFLLSDQKLTGEDYKDNLTGFRHWVKRGAKAAQLKQGIGAAGVMGQISGDYTEEEKFITEHIQKILSTKSNTYDFEVKKLGGKNGGYTIGGNSGATFLDTIWSAGELVSEDVMKAAMKASFEQNPQALQRLLATGNATLTHTKGGEWAEAMPRLLMEVRDELRGTQPQAAPQPTAPTPVSATMPQAPKAPKQQGLMNIHKVSLPNYQKAASRMEPVEVDAAWKIPMLQRLDAQMSDENTTDSNVEIKRQMDRVLQAISEDEYNRTADDRKERINRKMGNYERRNMQINALLDNTVGLLPSEIRETSEQIINYISDLVTELQENPDSVAKYFPNLRTELDFKTASRREIINAVNINNLLAQAKKHFGGISESYDSFSLMEQADLILDNWETVVEFGSDILLMNEGVSLEFNDNGNYDARSRDMTAQDYDNYSEPQDEESVREQEDEQEHWQVESKTISAFNSMSDLVRLALHKCYLLDREGNQILDKWGIPKRVNKIQAVSNILYWTQGTLDIKEVIEKLKLREAKHPWIGQLVDRLSDETGKETDFQSQFYGVMHRHFQLYGIGQREKGVYTSKILNNHVATTEVLNHITALFNAANHPLFFAHSVKEVALGKLKGKLADLKAIVDSHNIRMGDRNLTVGTKLTNEDISKASGILSEVSGMLGYEASREAVEDVLVEETLFSMYQALDTIANVLETQFNKQKRGNADNNYNPYNAEDSNNIRNATLKFLAPLTEEMEANNSNAIFEDGKLYQSFVIPSFLTQMFDAFGQEEGKFKEWIERSYGSSAWFKKDGRWRHPWLRMMTDEDGGANARKVFKHHIQLNFDKNSYMRGMSPEQYTLSCITNYHSEFVNKKDLTRCPAWFRVPIQSNKPSSEFIRFYSDRSADYKKHIVENVFEMFLQEVDRIDTVRKRNRGKGSEDAITSFDERGRRFLFCPWLNDYLEESGTTGTLLRDAEGNIDTARNNELKELLNKKLKAETELTDKETDQLRRLVQEATRNYMQSYVDNLLADYEESGMLKACDSIKGIHSVFASTRDAVENFLWNDFYAANSILQLTVVDKAFYKNSDELQKRLAELHAPGIRGNKYAVDYNGKPVSDGYYRTAIIGDLEGFKSNLIANIAEIFDKKIAAAKGDDRKSLEALKDYLVRPPKTNGPDDKGGVYWDINVTDGQAYSSPTSYRKKAFMFGKWSTEAEAIYNRLLEGDYTLSDLKVAFQPLKPFVYGHAMEDIGTGNSPIDVLPIPFQAKNSEYLLVMADALIRGEELGRPNLLGAIFDVMEDSAFTGRERDASGKIISKGEYNAQGIDTIQFVSAIKSGGQGVIDIAQFLEDKDGRAKAYHHMRSRIFSDTRNGDGTYYNYNAFVKKLDFDYFAIQQEVPAHFKEHAQAEGSQERMIIPSELSEKNHNGETNYYEWDDVYGKHHKLTAQEFRERYEEVHAENIQDSLDELTEFLGINSESKVERNLKLSEILQDEIMSSPRYGIDLFQACQINPATGEFRIPKGDPIQGKRIEQLINSIIKNRVNKQKIAGGPIVQVTNFGTSRQLHVRFNARSGGLLLLEEEWDAQPEHEAHQKYKSYDEYKKAEQAGIAYYEVFAPIGYKEYFELFRNPDGSINVEAIDKVSPELLKIFTCRIPTEDKYSIAHAKIVGFMPAFAGDAMMFPYELTLIDDSDFDVDKRYVMQKTFFRIKENRRKIEPKLFKFLCNAYKAKMGKEPSYDVKKKFSDDVNMFLDNPKEMKDADLMMQMLNIEYEYILKTEFPFLVEWPKEGTREARNNEIIDMDWAVMSNEMTADKALNPGGFEAPKKTAYVIAAYRNTNGRYSFEELQKKSTKELQKLASVDRDIAWFDTQVQYYRQNAAASTLIGIAAVAKVAHAVLERDNMFIDVEYFCHDNFKIADKEFHGLTHLDPTLDDSGTSVGKSLGSNIGACADAAKDPWLSFVNVDLATINVYNTMLRMGMPMDDAELFLGQDVISRILKELNQRKLVDKSASLTRIISERLEKLSTRYGIDSESDNMKYLSREELIEGLIPYREPSLPAETAEVRTDENAESTEDTEEKPETKLSEKDKERLIIDCKVLMAFQNLSTLAEAIRKPTFITRYNSVSSAVGPLVIDNIISEHKREDFAPDKDGMTGFYDEHMNMIDAKALLERHPILGKFWECFNIAQIMFSDMPTGHSQFKTLLTSLPPHISRKIYRDRQLLSKLSDFYQSFMLVQSGLVNPEHLRSFIFDFPNWFMGNGTDKDTGRKLQSAKEKYPHNALIQAIKFDYSKKTGRPFLKINTTGMSENEKEKLRMAWIDLHKDSPSLSRMLFTYCFFRGGIGFNPRTFMSLIPTYVKERLIVDLADGQKASYVDTYRKIPQINLSVLEEQFVRNNWNNSTLAPLIDNKNGTMTIGDDGRLYVATKNDLSNVGDATYIRVRKGKDTTLWKLDGGSKECKVFVKLEPLGNNGEYMEISPVGRISPIVETTEAVDDTPEGSDVENVDYDEVDGTPDEKETEKRENRNLYDLAVYMSRMLNVGEDVAKMRLDNLKSSVLAGNRNSSRDKFFVNLFKEKGLDLTPEQALEEFKKYC